MNNLSLIIELARQIIAVAEKSGRDTPKLTPIKELNLSTRAYNCLIRSDIEYVEKLIWLTKADIMKIRNMGKSTFDEINDKVKSIGLCGLGVDK